MADKGNCGQMYHYIWRNFINRSFHLFSMREVDL